MEWLETRNMTKVKQHLVPEAAVEQVQHCVLNSTDIEVDTTGVAIMLWSHPIFLNVFVDKCFGVCWVKVTQLIPTRASPLRHDVYFATVLAWSISQVESDVDPFTHAGEWRDWV